MDSVKLYPQQRLDLDDTRALQALVYDYVSEALGGVLGHMRGALSAPVITQTENNGAPYIELSAFQFVTSTPIEGSARSVTLPTAGAALTQFKNTVVSYIPSEENSTQISIDTPRAYYQDYVGAFLWARPIYVSTDTATRIKWDVSQGAEVSFNDETRESQRVEFAVQTNAPSYAAGEAKWAPIARLTAWSDADNAGSVASWQTISAYEQDTARNWIGGISGDNLSRSAVTFDYIMGNTPLYPMEQGRSYRGIGLADQTAISRYKIAQMQGYGVNDPTNTPSRGWYLPPLASLDGLYTETQDLRNQRTSQVVCIASVQIQAQYLPSTQDYQYLVSNAPNAVGVEAVRKSPLRSNRVSIELTDALLSEDWHILHIGCSQYMYRIGSNNVYDYNRVNFQIDIDPYVISDTAHNRLDDYLTTSGRGVTVELLPLFTANEEGIDDTHAGQNYVNIIGSEGANDNHNVFFSVAIFARHEDQ